MSEASTLHHLLDSRLREAFGEPAPILGRNDHWMLRPGPYQAAINVMIDRNPGRAVVWVFDPHGSSNDVNRFSISEADDIPRVIEYINHRVQRAIAMNGTATDPPSPPPAQAFGSAS